jgi:predicted SAM-dependent methyltransferase
MDDNYIKKECRLCKSDVLNTVLPLADSPLCDAYITEKKDQKYYPLKFDAIYSLDVMEHISIELENEFLKNICLSLQNNGVVIIGMPSLESQVFASLDSIAGHINCKTGENFKEILEQYFEQVFLFSMNDEVIHTGFTKMAHYLFCVCVTPKRENN